MTLITVNKNKTVILGITVAIAIIIVTIVLIRTAAMVAITVFENDPHVRITM